MATPNNRPTVGQWTPLERQKKGVLLVKKDDL